MTFFTLPSIESNNSKCCPALPEAGVSAYAGTHAEPFYPWTCCPNATFKGLKISQVFEYIIPFAANIYMNTLQITRRESSLFSQMAVDTKSHRVIKTVGINQSTPSAGFSLRPAGCCRPECVEQIFCYIDHSSISLSMCTSSSGATIGDYSRSLPF